MSACNGTENPQASPGCEAEGDDDQDEERNSFDRRKYDATPLAKGLSRTLIQRGFENAKESTTAAQATTLMNEAGLRSPGLFGCSCWGTTPLRQTAVARFLQR